MALQSTTALATITLQEASATVEFSGIPDTYRDLILVANFSTTTVYDIIWLNINGGHSGSAVGFRGNGSTAVGYTLGSLYLHYAGGTTLTPEVGIAEIIDYSATDKHKTILVRSDNPASKSEAIAQRWASTNAVTSVGVECSSYEFSPGSTFSLYGRIA